MNFAARRGVLGRRLLLPFWQRAPLWLRRRLIWLGTSKFLVGVAAVCLNSRNQMLLLRHRFHNEHPWGFPGGWVDAGEAPVQAIVREIREETGLEPVVEDLLLVMGDGKWVEIVYLCRVPDTEPVVQQSEAIEYRWVDPANYSLNLTLPQARAARMVAERLHTSGNPLLPHAR
jgi:mutator protein MutT